MLKQVYAGTAVPDLCREHGISTATFDKWPSKYGGMDVSLMTRMRELEEENRRFKNLYIEAQIKADIVAEALGKNSKAISPTQGGQMGSRAERPGRSAGVRGVWPERERMSLSAQAQCGEHQDCRVVAAADGESTELGLWSLLPVFAQRGRLSLEP